MATDGVWRDERQLPLEELTAAVATSATDGQGDDLAGNDAGIEQALTEEAGERPDGADGDPDPTSSAGRALRTDYVGRTGPN
ncbi:hypothetical protein Daura_35225 [Dactylosporangium aurantiacum]|uniref:Uncharacterized protein n=1 Tax=Dactylosporangium aurantiacum TaxID=35754 RepID=A0A9Q9ICK3_9ACTN|nr:hypothetical protein [Dactylosporangium aurantiacum]MDG6103574.1 hypothetical protein [Dactylosporangium aurantiacum]UWZ51933.1 hypothetical protein Daura_35225 [Dactylosporangium aurantiacum]